MLITNRVELIQDLIDKHSFQSYLEIGARDGFTFNAVKCPSKYGVDPVLRKTFERPGFGYYAMTSDDFFKMGRGPFDLIFIDGLHLYEQTLKDVVNAWNSLTLEGFIVMHDCLPANAQECVREYHEGWPWTGDVWKSFLWFRSVYPDVDSYVVDIDHGCGVIRKSVENVTLKDTDWLKDLTFEWLQAHMFEMNVRDDLNV